MRQPALLAVHRITGLLAGIFILLLSVSGAILVFHEEIDSLNEPPPVLRANAPLIGIDSCYLNIRKAFPHAAILSAAIPESNQRPYRFSIADPDPDSAWKKKTVFLQPQNAELIGVRETESGLLYQFSRMHSNFFLQKKGEWLLGVVGVMFIISLLTGLILYHKSFVPVLLFRRKTGYKMEWHQWIGTYALLFNLLMAVSGVWMQRYVFKPAFYRSPAYHPHYEASVKPAYSFDSGLEKIKREYPEFTSYRIYFPGHSGGTMTVYGSRSNNSFLQSRELADAIFVDSSGAISGKAFLQELDASTVFDISNAQWHGGQYGGIWVKLLYAILGSSGAILSITGFVLWYRRRRNRS